MPSKRNEIACEAMLFLAMGIMALLVLDSLTKATSLPTPPSPHITNIK